MKSKTNFLFILIAWLFFTSCSDTDQLPSNDNEIVIAKNDSLYSQILEEERHLFIHVPSEFNQSYPQVKYPVLYVLDPSSHFLSIVSMMDRMSTNIGEEICPQMIVVGVRNTDRIRDMFPINNEDRFHQFLEKELIPYIDQKYPTQPYRVLFGHSLTGLRTIHTAIFHKELFKAYLAIDPSLCHEYCSWYEKHQEVIKEYETGNNHMFLAMANTMNGKDTTEVKLDTSGRASHMNAMMEFSERMTKKGNTNFQWQYYPDESHNSVTLRATLDGLEHLFSWYKNESYDLIFDENTTPEAALAAYQAHFEQLSIQLGYTVIPPEGQVSTIVWYLNEIKQMPQKAYLFAKMNAENYPDSEHAQNQLQETMN
jgi:predicted alpha/beta superfamily hydrolase